MELKRLELGDRSVEPLHITVPINALTDERVGRLKRLLADHPGDAPVFLHVGGKVIRLAGSFSVDARNGLLAELRVLLGPDCLSHTGPGTE